MLSMKFLVGRALDGAAVYVVNGENAVNLTALDASVGADLMGIIANPALIETLAAKIAAAKSVPVASLTPTLPVAKPKTIICLGLNYTDHLQRRGVCHPRLPHVVHARQEFDHGGQSAFGTADLFGKAGLRSRTDGYHRQGRTPYI
jgi:hypothetical protein